MATNRDKVRGEWLLSWLYPVLAALLAFVVPIVWDAAMQSDRGPFASPLGYIALVLLLAAVALAIVQGSTATANIRERRNQLRDYNHRLVDTIRVLGDLPDAANGAKARRDFLETVTREAKSIMALDGQRICVYELDSADRHSAERDSAPDAGDEEDEFLRLIAFAGRADHPRERFTADTPYGADAIANAMGNTARCYDKAEKPSFNVDRDPDSPWQSFLAVPLHVDHKPRGLMTIDTTLSMKFTSDHIAIAMTIGRFIEIGLKSSYAAAVETAPEVQNVQARLAELGAESPTIVPVESQEDRR
jgi:transcriptional regulator with GAF, ATPase, and Fis domain